MIVCPILSLKFTILRVTFTELVSFCKNQTLCVSGEKSIFPNLDSFMNRNNLELNQFELCSLLIWYLTLQLQLQFYFTLILESKTLIFTKLIKIKNYCIYLLKNLFSNFSLLLSSSYSSLVYGLFYTKL